MQIYFKREFRLCFITGKTGHNWLYFYSFLWMWQKSIQSLTVGPVQGFENLWDLFNIGSLYYRLYLRYFHLQLDLSLLKREQRRGEGRRDSLRLSQEMFIEPAFTATKIFWDGDKDKWWSECYIRNHIRKCFLLLSLEFINVLSRALSTEDNFYRPKRKANTN